MTKFIQFELWKECKQNCKFCCNKGQKPVDKSKSCMYVLDVLKKLNPNEVDIIGLIGGELFNGEMKHCMNAFFLILKRIQELNPKKIYLATSLIYNIEDYLVPILKAMDKVLKILDKVVICTSWDIQYRFKTPIERHLWFKNMFYLNKHFPQVELHTEIILTQYFIDLVLEDKLDLNIFKDTFSTSIDFIEPSSGLYYTDKYECQKDIPGFFPTKSSFIKFLAKMKNKIDLNTFLSMDLRSDELYYIENGNRKVAKNRRKGDGRCELSDKTKKYDIGFIDSEDSMRDIVQLFQQTYNS